MEMVRDSTRCELWLIIRLMMMILCAGVGWWGVLWQSGLGCYLSRALMLYLARSCCIQRSRVLPAPADDCFLLQLVLYLLDQPPFA